MMMMMMMTMMMMMMTTTTTMMMMMTFTCLPLANTVAMKEQFGERTIWDAHVLVQL